jgi:hypothetical protein
MKEKAASVAFSLDYVNDCRYIVVVTRQDIHNEISGIYNWQQLS